MKKLLTALILMIAVLACFVSCTDLIQNVKEVTFKNPTAAPMKLKFKNKNGSYSSLYEIPAKSELKIDMYVYDEGKYATISIYSICYEEGERTIYVGDSGVCSHEPEYGFITIENKTGKTINDIKINDQKISSYDIENCTEGNNTSLEPLSKKSFRVFSHTSSKEIKYTVDSTEKTITYNAPSVGNGSDVEITV